MPQDEVHSMLSKLCMGFVALTITGEYLKSLTIQYCAKMIASAIFVCCAIMQGALDSHRGWSDKFILFALLFSLLGDILMISDSRSRFLGGLIAFFVAHVMYIFSFITSGDILLDNIAYFSTPLFMLLMLLAIYILPHVGPSLFTPVCSYFVIQYVLLLTAFGTGNYTKGFAAFAFMVSDVGVGREKFVQSGLVNRLVCLPLYYVAQLTFAHLDDLHE